MVKVSVLAVMLLAGLFSAVMSASASVAREIHSGTALAVLAKPVSRAQFLLAKYVGLALSLVVLTYVNCVAALLATRMTFDAYGDADLAGLAVFCGALAAAYAIGGLTNYFMRRPFVSDAVLAVALMVTVAFIVLQFIPGPAERAANEFVGLDWRMAPASALILMALLVLAALALACSTRLEVIPTLSVCSALFLLGMVSDYFWGTRAVHGNAWANVLYTVTPNWQLFWVSDLLEGKGPIPVDYLGKALGYTVGYVGAVLALALVLFEDRELS
jgi:ABC-type transport system involved in multi-copper enzyme maturation permease subunit